MCKNHAHQSSGVMDTKGKQLTMSPIEHYKSSSYFRATHIYPLFYLKYKGRFFMDKVFQSKISMNVK